MRDSKPIAELRFREGTVYLHDRAKLPARRIRGTDLQGFWPASDGGVWCQQYGMVASLSPNAMPPGDWEWSRRAEAATFAALARLMERARREWLAEGERAA